MMRRTIPRGSATIQAAVVSGRGGRGAPGSRGGGFGPDGRGDPPDTLKQDVDFIHRSITRIDRATVAPLAPPQEYTERPVHLCAAHGRKYWLQLDPATSTCTVSCGPDQARIQAVRTGLGWGEVCVFIRDDTFRLFDPAAPAFKPFARGATAELTVPRDGFVERIMEAANSKFQTSESTRSLVLRNVSGVGKTRTAIDLRQFTTAAAAGDWELLPLYLGLGHGAALTPHETLEADRTPERAAALVLHRLLCVLRQLPLPDPDRPERTVLERLLVPYGECPGDFLDPRFDEARGVGCGDGLEFGSLPPTVDRGHITTLLRECRGAVTAVAELFKTLPVSEGRTRRLALLPIVDDAQDLLGSFPGSSKNSWCAAENAPQMALSCLRQLQCDVHEMNQSDRPPQVLGVMLGTDPGATYPPHQHPHYKTGTTTVVSDERDLFVGIDNLLAAAGAVPQTALSPRVMKRRAVMHWPVVRDVFQDTPLPGAGPADNADVSDVVLLKAAVHGHAVRIADLEAKELPGHNFVAFVDRSERTAVPLATYALFERAFAAVTDRQTPVPSLVSETPGEVACALLLRLAALNLSGGPQAFGAFIGLGCDHMLNFGRVPSSSQCHEGRVKVSWHPVAGGLFSGPALSSGDLMAGELSFADDVRAALADVLQGCAGQPSLCMFHAHGGAHSGRDIVLLATRDGQEWQLLVADAKQYLRAPGPRGWRSFLPDGDRVHEKLTTMLGAVGFRMTAVEKGTVKDVIVAPRAASVAGVPRGQVLSGDSFPHAARVLRAVLQVGMPEPEST